MKKKIFGASIIVSILFVGFIGRGIYFYARYAIPNKNYFGVHYNEVLYPMSFQDNKRADEIMEIIEDAFSYIGNTQDATSRFGELSRYCITDKDAVTENHELKLVTADFNKDKGYLWFVYSQEAFDHNNQTTNGSSDILVRATLGKNDMGWTVVDTKEHP